MAGLMFAEFFKNKKVHVNFMGSAYFSEGAKRVSESR
jgi:hypothetical protein